jgi:hypothetical protein
MLITLAARLKAQFCGRSLAAIERFESLRVHG